MLSLNLNPIFKVRNIENPHHFLVKAGIPSYAVVKILNGSVTTLKLTHIESLCNALFCEPSDLLLFTPTKGETYPDNHPLLKLKRAENTPSFQDIIANMLLREIKEATKAFIESKKEN